LRHIAAIPFDLSSDENRRSKEEKKEKEKEEM
jgi:hypothetical protein